MTDAEIFKRNVKRICKQKGMKMGCVDLEAGYSEKYVSQLAEMMPFGNSRLQILRGS